MTRLVAIDLSCLRWRTSSHSAHASDCVEVAGTPGVDAVGGRIAVRDSKDRRGPVLVFSAGEWDAFIREVNART